MGMRVEPPTITTSCNCLAFKPASRSALWKGCLQRSTRSAVNCSNLLRLRFKAKCFGPELSAVIKGRLISVCGMEDNSILAFSAASRKRWSAWRSWLRSMPCSRLNSSINQRTMRSSQSSPPKWVSPLVDFTSMTPSPTSRTETSKVPPPRSKTKMVSSVFLSSP